MNFLNEIAIIVLKTIFDIIAKGRILDVKFWRISYIVHRCERELYNIANIESKEDVMIVHYGAYDIHTSNLVYWICIQTDYEKERLSKILNPRIFKEFLRKNDYPIDSCDKVHFGVESRETVLRESDGNWWHHWK